jgi:hypothetical protein
VLFATLFVAFNLNGREIGSYDSQPTKFAARELLLRTTLHLDELVRQTPEYAERWGFILAADGHYRSVYSPVPSLLAAAIAWPFWAAGVIDVEAPRAPALMAKIAASLLVSLAVVLAYFSARQRISRPRAALLALGLGLGTGFWSTVSQTLWQTETAVLGLALAVFAFARPEEHLGPRDTVLIGLGLALAGVTRPQLAPIVAVLLAGTWVRSSFRRAAAATTIVVLSAAAIALTNFQWYGHPLGAQALLQDVNAQLHDTGATFALSAEGLAGLLVSPSRGILIFSPIVLFAAIAMPGSFGAGRRSALPWCSAALVAQYLLYGSYSVWWGGHTYGPRYMLDLLPVAVPLAATTLGRMNGRSVSTWVGGLALTWSVVVAATGAFSYPHDRWNTEPSEIDLDRTRRWSWTDNQIRRCWTRGMSPQNFTLIDRSAVRRVSP